MGAERIAPTSKRAIRVEQTETPVSVTAGTARSALEGATLGWREEIENNIAEDMFKGNAPFRTPEITGLPSPQKQNLYDPQIQQEVESKYAAEQEQYRRENPLKSLAAEFAGGMATGGVGAAKTATMQGTPRLLTLMGLGGGYGAITGAGYADKGEALEDALTYGLVGSGLGVAIPFIGSKAGDVVKKLMQGKSVNKADRAILKAIYADDQTPEQIKNLLRQWPDATLPDVGGKNMTNLTRESRAVGGEAANMAENFFMDRMKGEYTRLMNAFKNGLGNGSDFFGSKKALETSRKEIATPLYREAYDTAITLTDGLKDIFNRPAGKAALAAAKKKAANEGVKLADDAIDVRTIDYAKRALDDKIGTLMRAGKKDDARILINLKNAMLGEVDPQVPQFAQARQIWSGSAELEGALDDGAKFLRGESDLIAADIANMSDAQKEFFRLGALRSIKNYISKTRDTNSIAAKFQNEAMRERLEAVFPDQQAYSTIVDMIEKESRFGVVRNDVLRGSQTYEKMLANQTGTSVDDLAVDLAQGRAGGVVRGLWDMAKDIKSRPSQKTANDIIRRTTQNDLATNLNYVERLKRGDVRIDPRYRQLMDAMAIGGGNVAVQRPTRQ